MYSFQTLEITGYRGEPVPNTFFRHDQEAEQVAIMLPGIGYTCQMPFLYYPTRLLLARGAEVLWVEYAYSRREDFQALSPSEQERWLLADVTAACRAAIGQHRSEQVLLIGKSLGTIAMGHLLTTEPMVAHARAIWLTPLLRNDRLRAQIQRSGHRSLFVIGTADPHYHAAYLAEVQAATRGETVIIEGGDHSLEVGGDVFASLQAVEQVLRAMEAFLRK
jgi:predicted alpha/beta-hydrolase family hydrolase